MLRDLREERMRIAHEVTSALFAETSSRAERQRPPKLAIFLATSSAREPSSGTTKSTSEVYAVPYKLRWSSKFVLRTLKRLKMFEVFEVDISKDKDLMGSESKVLAQSSH